MEKHKLVSGCYCLFTCVFWGISVEHFNESSGTLDRNVFIHLLDHKTVTHTTKLQGKTSRQWRIVFKKKVFTVDDFRVAFCLCFKASPSAKPLIGKLVLYETPGLALKQRRNVNRKSPILYLSSINNYKWFLISWCRVLEDHLDHTMLTTSNITQMYGFLAQIPVTTEGQQQCLGHEQPLPTAHHQAFTMTRARSTSGPQSTSTRWGGYSYV